MIKNLFLSIGFAVFTYGIVEYLTNKIIKYDDETFEMIDKIIDENENEAEIYNKNRDVINYDNVESEKSNKNHEDNK